MNAKAFGLQTGTASTAPAPGPALGLHGHVLGRNVARVAVAEATGTYVLVLGIIAAAIAATLAKPVAGEPWGSLAVPLAGGLALAVTVAILGPVSGAHFNPAVTVGLAVSRRFPWSFVPAYVAAQLGGAVTAAFTAWWFYGEQARVVAKLGTPVPAMGVGAGRVFGVEAIVTFILLLVVVSIASDRRINTGLASLSIGGALGLAILVSGPLTGAGVNPARALGPAIVAGSFTDWWAYLAAPLVGGVISVALYHRVFAPAVAPV